MLAALANAIHKPPTFDRGSIGFDAVQDRQPRSRPWNGRVPGNPWLIDKDESYADLYVDLVKRNHGRSGRILLDFSRRGLFAFRAN